MKSVKKTKKKKKQKRCKSKKSRVYHVCERKVKVVKSSVKGGYLIG
jgi:hypothetical protein